MEKKRNAVNNIVLRGNDNRELRQGEVSQDAVQLAPDRECVLSSVPSEFILYLLNGVWRKPRLWDDQQITVLAQRPCAQTLRHYGGRLFVLNINIQSIVAPVL